MSTLLEVRDLHKSFAGEPTLAGVDLALKEGERRAIIGPNGAGKTTLLNLIGGQLRPQAGHILFAGQEISGWPPHRRAREGIGRTFQISSAFPSLSLSDNMLAAAQAGHSWLHYAPEARRRAEQLLELLALGAKAALPVAQLSHGERRALEIGLALAARPRLLLLDEPTAGLAAGETEGVTKLLQSLEGVALLIVEHDMQVVEKLADSITVLHHGRVLAQGSTLEIQANPQVQAIYLGEAHAET